MDSFTKLHKGKGFTFFKVCAMTYDKSFVSVRFTKLSLPTNVLNSHFVLCFLNAPGVRLVFSTI